MWKKLLTLFYALFCMESLAQTNDSTCYSLEDIIHNPLKVKKLVIKNETSKTYKTIPKQIFKCTNLVELVLFNTNLRRIPDEISTLENLRILSIPHGHLKRVSSKIGTLRKLHYLDISNNRLKKLPKELLQLKYLETLVLSSNQLQKLDLPKSLGLKSIYADHNQIDTLYDELFGFYDSIEILSLKSNALRYIPSDITQAAHLQMINLNNNRLRDFPEEFLEMPHLEEIRLGKNQINELPELVEKSTIKLLDLSENPLKKWRVRQFAQKSEIPTLIFMKKLNHWEYLEE